MEDTHMEHMNTETMNMEDTNMDLKNEDQNNPDQNTEVQDTAPVKRKVKKTWEENEAPLLRWILTIVSTILIGMVIGNIISVIISRLPCFDSGKFLAPERDLISGVAVFAVMFLFFWLFLRTICRTSLRAFFFGKNRRADVKQVLIIGGLYMIGMLLSMIPNSANISFMHPDPALMTVNILFCLCFLWMQTTMEEIVFRGLFLRIPYKNKVPVLPKGLLVAFLSSLLFMAGHLANPEVTTQSGLNIALMASSYFVSGFMMFLSNLMLGGMEAGMIIHFINNFFCFVFVSSEVTVIVSPALFVDYTQDNVALRGLIATVIAYIPSMVYLVWRYRRKRAEMIAAQSVEPAESDHNESV